GLGILGWVASEQFKPLMPPATNFGYFNIVNLCLGLVCGWVVLGTRVGRGYYESLGAGLTGTSAMVFWAVFIQSLNEMLKQALERRFDGMLEAIIAIFKIALDFGILLIDFNLIAVLVIGGMIVGFCTEWTCRRWS
ncbi:MAG TPA: TrgA family protein, partial [Devosia sp.]|nr:TrgA family protein [Devosia sp.]